MESNKYNIENFERFLREKSDEFRMYPSKRVWYSIYNNMHPGNRFPSVSMSIVLIGFLFLIGYLNTDASKQIASGQQAIAANSLSQTNINFNTGAPIYKQLAQTALPSSVAAINNNTATTKLIADANGQNRNSYGYNNHLNRNIKINSTQNLVSIYNIGAATNIPITEATVGNISSNNDILLNENNLPAINTGKALLINIESEAAGLGAGNTVSIINKPNSNVISSANAVANKQQSKVSGATNKNVLTATDKGWIEDFALHNRHVKKLAGKLSLQAYITPSVVYRKLNNNAFDKPLAGSGNTGYNNFDIENSVTQKPSFGIETGVSLQYDVARKIKLKVGAQANYTRYNVHAFETNHPVATTITMNSEDETITYEMAKMSNYSNNFGISPVKLHNETYQLSLPIGADYMLATFDNISWYAGATIQPTLVIYGRSYVISTDRRNYVQDKSLLNRFNLNAGFETYLSYKKCGYSLQLGPQYRTQIFSTNTKSYSVEERLQNLGFKIGIAKRL